MDNLIKEAYKNGNISDKTFDKIIPKKININI